jgi:hypothetical protein
MHSIEDLFAKMAQAHRELKGQSLSRIGDLGLPLITVKTAETK